MEPVAGERQSVSDGEVSCAAAPAAVRHERDRQTTLDKAKESYKVRRRRGGRGVTTRA